MNNPSFITNESKERLRYYTKRVKRGITITLKLLSYDCIGLQKAVYLKEFSTVKEMKDWIANSSYKELTLERDNPSWLNN